MEDQRLVDCLALLFGNHMCYYNRYDVYKNNMRTIIVLFITIFVTYDRKCCLHIN
jgi:hypothetical protein